MADLLPRTNAERRAWVLFSMSAGITEEILYRAFVMSVVAAVLPDGSAIAIVLVSAAMFGLAHLYQGLKGVMLTSLLGFLLGTVVLSAGLLPAMVIHALIDLRILIVPPDIAVEAAEISRDTGT